MITRDKALELLNKYLKTANTIKHLLATEAIMKVLAQRLEPDKEEIWAMAGLIHDLDYEVMADAKEHGLKTIDLLTQEQAELPAAVIQAIKAHNHTHNQSDPPSSLMDWSLLICDSLTGLIVATALVRPDKKLASVKVKSVMKKFKSSSFAAGTRREDIKLCEEKLGIPLPEFVDLSLKAMQGIAQDLGL